MKCHHIVVLATNIIGMSLLSCFTLNAQQPKTVKKKAKKTKRACCIRPCCTTQPQQPSTNSDLIIEGAITNAASDQGFPIACITITNDTDEPAKITKVGCQATAAEHATAVGFAAQADTALATALGNTAQAKGEYSSAFGAFTTATELQAIAVGCQTLASGMFSTAVGAGAYATEYATTALGNHAVASSGFATSVGVNTTASSYGATALGSYANANNDRCTAVGNNAQATNINTTALGYDAQATASNTTALGHAAQALVEGSIALGHDAVSNGFIATAVGGSAHADGNYSTALGHDTRANLAAVAVGNGAAALHNGTVAVGNGTIASGNDSTAIGLCAHATHDYAMALGAGAQTTKEHQLRLGATGGGDCLAQFLYPLQEVVTTATIISEQGDFVAEVGNVRAPNGRVAAMGFDTLSDMHAKQNIQPSSLGLNFIEKLNPVVYQYKVGHDQQTQHCGLLAQEILKLIKENNIQGFGGVTYDAATGRHSISYTEFIAPLVTAIQELATRNNTLELAQQELIKQVALLQSSLAHALGTQKRV